MSTPGDSLRTGPVQRKRPAAGRAITSRSTASAQTSETPEAAVFAHQAAQANFRRLTHLGAPAISSRSTHWKDSALQTSTFAPEYGARRTHRSPWLPNPAPILSTARRSSTSETTSWMPTTGSRMQDAGETRIEAERFRWRNRRPSKKTSFSFRSYEGLRVRQPKVANTYVPSLASRQNAPAPFSHSSMLSRCRTAPISAMERQHSPQATRNLLPSIPTVYASIISSRQKSQFSLDTAMPHRT